MSERKIGAFVCYCGGNISDYVDVEHVRDVVESEPGVVVAKTAMFTCSDEAQQEIIDIIKEQHLDGIVVASCSPKLHLGTFRAMARRAGLNPYMYEQVNLREQCSWTHTNDREGATKKAIQLVRAGIARVRFCEPLETIRVKTVPHVLVIGAGVSGLRAAVGLGDLGLEVTLIEREDHVGGQIARWGPLYPSGRRGDELVKALTDEIARRKNVHLYTGARVVEKSGSVGKFQVTLKTDSGETYQREVGAIVVATGFRRYEPAEGEYAFGTPGVVTLEEFRSMLDSAGGGEVTHQGWRVRSVVYIYCVGSRQADNGHPYCSRYCCTAAVHSAVVASQRDPSLRQYHLFRDLRTYGQQELIYEEALRRGSVFLKFADDDPPVVSGDGKLKVTVKDQLTAGEQIEFEPDLVVLVTGMEARENAALVDVLKIPLDKNGFFNEIHPKLRPVETVMDGILLAGTAQGPKNVPESVASGMASVAKGAGLLLKGYVDLEPYVAEVDPRACRWCDVCQKECIYGAVEKVTQNGKEVARIIPSLCKGGGACAAVCPENAINLKGYRDEQITALIDAMVKEVA
jgi:heterodisulfide reductase subunit A